MLEQLENRLAPAVYHVNTFLDTAAVNINTAQDATGHVSLRAAVTAADASPQDDTIVLAPGVYTVQDPLPVKGNLQITGEGPGKTIIETRHLDRLFAIDQGSLQLTGLTLDGGPGSANLAGDIHLTNCQVTDTDVAAVVAAALANVETSTLPQTVPPIVKAQAIDSESIQALPSLNSLVGKAGGGSTSADLEPVDPHQAYFRVDADTTQDEPATDLPDEMKQSRAPDKSDAGSAPIHSAPGKSAAALEKETRQEQRETNSPIKDSDSARVLEMANSKQAIVLLFVGCASLSNMAMSDSSTRERSYIHSPRRHWRAGDKRRQRGPPACGPPISRSTKKGGQRCLPFFVFSRVTRPRRPLIFF